MTRSDGSFLAQELVRRGYSRRASTLTKGFIYARLSSEMQNEISSDDQLQISRALAERRGWSIEQEFTAAAVELLTAHDPGSSDDPQ